METIEEIRESDQQGLVLAREASSLVARVETLVIADDATYALAVEYEKLGKMGEDKAEAQERPNIQRWFDGHRQALKKLADLKAPFTLVKKTASDKRMMYEREQERLRLEAELAVQRERERLEDAERQRVAAEEMRLRKEAEDTRLQDAIDAELRGDTATAERLIEEPIASIVVPAMPVFQPPISIPVLPKIKGAGHRTDYVAELENLVEIIKAAAGGNTVALGCLTFDQSRANRLAASLKLTMKVPGIKVVERRIATMKA